MDPFWAWVAEFWWIAPTVVGAGAVGTVLWRIQGALSERRLAYDAALHELHAAKKDATAQRLAVRVARAEHARVVAEKSASRAAGADVSAVRRELREAERATKAAQARVRAYRAQAKAAKAELAEGHSPLARLHARHEALTARWMQYETDPEKLISFPAMSDVRNPATAAFLNASHAAHEAKAQVTGRRVGTAEFITYRNAVTQAERAFNEAERVALGQAPDAEAESPWYDVADNVTDVVNRVSTAAVSAFEAWKSRERRPR